MLKVRKLSVLGLLLGLLISVSLFAGCASQPSAEAPPAEQPTQTEAPTTNQAPAVQPQLDAEQVIKEAAFKYYDKMPNHIYKISEDETKELLDKGELKDYLVLDIRDQKSYDEGHIQGAIFVPFKEVGKNLDLIATNAKGKKGILVVCVTGQTAGQTVAALNMVGLPSRSINLGMKLGWLAKKYPTETTSVQPIAAEAYDWGDKAPVKEAIEKYFEKMPGGAYDQYKIGLDDLRSQLENNPEKFVVIDIRGTEEFNKGTIKGAIDIPFKEVHKHFEEITELAKGKTAVVACFTGQTAGQTDAILNLIGIKTLSLHRGINGGWVEEKGFEVIKPVN